MANGNETPETPRQALVPSGAFSFPIGQVQETRWFGFLLLPEFTLLAFSSALDPLRIANQLAQRPLYGWRVLSEDGRSVLSSSGVDVGANSTLENLSPDMRLFVCSGNKGIGAASDATLAAVRRHARFGGKLGGICTGAMTLARAGLLDGKRFTLHWENKPGFSEVFPNLTPTDNRFEDDCGILTCGGGSAATEMILSEIARDYGQEFAIFVADMCLNDLNKPSRQAQRSSLARAIDSRNPKVLAAVQCMHANIEDPLTLEEIAHESSLSRRQLERHFHNLLSGSPATVYRNIRLEHARALVVETDMSVLEIATACGFNSTSVFSRHFKKRYGNTPSGVSDKRV